MTLEAKKQKSMSRERVGEALLTGTPLDPRDNVCWVVPGERKVFEVSMRTYLRDYLGMDSRAVNAALGG